MFFLPLFMLSAVSLYALYLECILERCWHIQCHNLCHAFSFYYHLIIAEMRKVSSLPRCCSMTRIHLSHAFHNGYKLVQDYSKAARVACDRWWRSPAENNTGQSTCQRMICAQSPLGVVVCTRLSVGITAHCVWWQVPHVMERWGCGVFKADMTSRGRGSMCLFGDGSCWDFAGVWSPPPEVLSPQSCNHSRLHVTAPCSNWPVTLSALGGGGEEGLAFVGLPWRLGHLMRTSTLWLMTSLSPSDILQMDNLLHHSHTRTTIHKNKGTELGVVRPHWIEDSFPFCLFSPWINKWQVDFSSNASF